MSNPSAISFDDDYGNMCYQVFKGGAQIQNVVEFWKINITNLERILPKI